MQDNVYYPVLSLVKLTFLFLSYVNILQKPIVFYVRRDVFIHPAANRREVDPDTKFKTEFMSAAIQKQGASTGGRI